MTIVEHPGGRAHGTGRGPASGTGVRGHRAPGWREMSLAMDGVFSASRAHRYPTQGRRRGTYPAQARRRGTNQRSHDM